MVNVMGGMVADTMSTVRMSPAPAQLAPDAMREASTAQMAATEQKRTNKGNVDARFAPSKVLM